MYKKVKVYIYSQSPGLATFLSLNPQELKHTSSTCQKLWLYFFLALDKLTLNSNLRIRKMSFLKKVIYFLIIFLIGCSHLSVRHLEKSPLLTQQKTSLEMRYLKFSYTPLCTIQGYRVKGRAFFKQESIPGWAKYIQELWLAIYLSDAKGKVLAKQLKVYLPQKLEDSGVPFEFSLTPEEIPSKRPLFITFGYSFKLTPAANYKPGFKSSPLTEDKDLIFYASQGALNY